MDGAANIRSDPENYFLPLQYDNPANARAHTETTAVEIMEQTEGRVEHFVAVMGTTGTLVGTGRGLKRKKPGPKVCGVMPSESFHGLEGMKHIPTSILPRIYDEMVHDDLILVDTEASYGIVDRLALEEGILRRPLLGGYHGGCARGRPPDQKGRRRYGFS